MAWWIMAEHIAQLVSLSNDHVSRPRMRALVVPREHGAWGMLLVPLATGAMTGLLHGGRASFLPLLIVATLTIFWLRTPVESWLGTNPIKAQSVEERKAVEHFIVMLVGIAALTLGALFVGGRNEQLVLLGLVAATAFAGQAFLKKLSRRTRMLSQFVGAIGLTSTAPAGYCVAVGHLDTRAFLLWLANWIFAIDQIHFVQVRIHSNRATGFTEKMACGWAFLVTQAVLVAMLVGIWRARMLPALALLAFGPALARGIVWFFMPPRPLAVRRLGWTELAHAVTFGILLVAGFSIHP
jgi:YwiC-like protein